MNQLDKETQQAVDSQYKLHIEKRDRIMKNLATQDKTHPMLKEVNDQINELAQLKQASDICFDEPVIMNSVRQRVAYVMFGMKHSNRRDASDV